MTSRKEVDLNIDIKYEMPLAFSAILLNGAMRHRPKLVKRTRYPEISAKAGYMKITGNSSTEPLGTQGIPLVKKMFCTIRKIRAVFHEK